MRLKCEFWFVVLGVSEFVFSLTHSLLDMHVNVFLFFGAHLLHGSNGGVRCFFPRHLLPQKVCSRELFHWAASWQCYFHTCGSGWAGSKPQLLLPFGRVGERLVGKGWDGVFFFIAPVFSLHNVISSRTDCCSGQPLGIANHGSYLYTGGPPDVHGTWPWSPRERAGNLL